jgi:hypothetical protein
MPLDVEPTPEGNVWLDEHRVAHVLKSLQVPPIGALRFSAHWGTCEAGRKPDEKRDEEEKQRSFFDRWRQEPLGGPPCKWCGKVGDGAYVRLEPSGITLCGECERKRIEEIAT